MQSLIALLHKKRLWLAGHIHQFFEVGVAVKGIQAILEFAGAIFVYFISGREILRIVGGFTHRELVEDPHDFIAGFFMHSADHFVAAKTFVAAYLLVAAIANTTLVIGLYANKRIMYPIAIGISGLFVLYQLYRLSISFSYILCTFTIADLLIMWVIYLEYKRRWKSVLTEQNKKSA